MAIPAEAFLREPGASGTLQQQIREQVAAGVLSGRFRPGDRMPSCRALARHLGVARITVTLAYAELVAGDYLAARDRSGYFVSESAPAPLGRTEAAQADPVDWDRAIVPLDVARTGPIRPTDWRRYRYPFIYGQADAELFDYQNWRLCALRALGLRDFEALTADRYESDDPMLVDFVVRHILPRRGIAARPEEVLLTLGAQNALWITVELLLTPERTAAMEEPGYPGLRAILAAGGCRRTGIPIDADGLIVEDVPADVDVVYCTPGRHCPTNAPMSERRRGLLLERAATEGFVIVEDDYEIALPGDGTSPALKAMGGAGGVVHVGSFSKALFPGLRLGYLVAPEPFIRKARALRGLALRHPPGHIQRTVAYFLSLGHYDAQLARIGRAYRSRRAAMSEAIEANGLARASDADGGSSFWMRAPEGVDADSLAEELRARDVLIEPGGVFFDPEMPDRRHYRLAYSSIPVERIGEGIARLASVIGR